ncbi:uncharacterized protein [Musca autumnalis]|uniref:uncharacterized protein n=1 Tax=Musca autumnalis TaxID=221902 RepID=UPI003CEF9BBC
MSHFPAIVVGCLCVILFTSGLVECQESHGEKILLQHFTNVNKLRTDIEKMPNGMEIIKKKIQQTTRLIDDIKTAKDNSSSSNKNEEICQRMSAFVEQTKNKHQSFEKRIVNKLDEIQAGQNNMALQILSKKDCHSNNILAAIAATTEPPPSTDSLAQLKVKLENFEKQLKNFDNQQRVLQTQQDEQMKLLQEIMAKLLQHKEKFINFEQEVPTVTKAAATSVKDARSQIELTKLPMKYVLGMTQKQQQTKENK